MIKSRSKPIVSSSQSNLKNIILDTATHWWVEKILTTNREQQAPHHWESYFFSPTRESNSDCSELIFQWFWHLFCWEFWGSRGEWVVCNSETKSNKIFIATSLSDKLHYKLLTLKIIRIDGLNGLTIFIQFNSYLLLGSFNNSFVNCHLGLPTDRNNLFVHFKDVFFERVKREENKNIYLKGPTFRIGVKLFKQIVPIQILPFFNRLRVKL